ncbi:MAG: MFS transporter [Spirochaetales bacterium]|nr:MFS transporter [Spirochaetales bacterium]
MKKLLSPKFVIVSLSFFFFALGNTLFDLLPLHLETIAVGKKEIGFIMSFSGLGGFAALLPLAMMIDRVSLKNLLSAAIGILVISQTVYLGGAAPYPFYAVPLFIRGALLSLFMISFMTLISHIVPDEKRMMGFSIFGIMGQLPFPLSIGIGEKIYHLAGFKVITLIAFSCFIISFVILRFYREEKPVIPHLMQNSLRDMMLIFKSKSIYPFLFSFFILAYAFGTLQVFLPGFLFSRGINRISLFWIIFPSTIILLRLFFARVFDRFPRTRMLILPLIFLPVSFIILLSVSGYNQLIFPAIVYGIAHGVMFPVLNAAIIDHAPEGFRGRVMVISQLTISLGFFLSARTGGLIADTASIDAVFQFTAAFSCSGILLFTVAGIMRNIRNTRGE